MALLDPEEIKRSDDEHKAWLVFGQEWRAAFPDHDMNDAKFNPLIRAIEVWGEMLADIRVNQSEAVRSIARQDKLANYLSVAGHRH